METKHNAGLPSWLEPYNLAPVIWEGIEVFVGVLPTALLEQNDGQIEGLPRNPREWTREDFENLKKSIVETPELTAARGCIVYPRKDAEKLVALGGNMRLAAVKELKKKTIPVAVYPENTTQAKLMEIAAKDNGVFGKWDFDALGNEWDSLPLGEWGIPAWKAPIGDIEEIREEVLKNGESEGSGADNVPTLKFGNRTVEMNEEELEALNSKYDAYVATFGVSYGFVNSLLYGNDFTE